MFPGGKVGGWVVIGASVLSAAALVGLVLAYLSHKKEIDNAIASAASIGSKVDHATEKFGFLGKIFG